MGLSASLSTAIQGLATAQRGMDVTSQNVVNANTPGYSRQQIHLAAVGTTTGASFHTGNAAFFGGVEVTGLERVRDAFLEATTSAANSRMSALSAHTSALTSAEGLVAEPSDTGLQTIMTSFFTAWHDLGAAPTDPGAAATVVERGHAVSDRLKYVADGIDAQWQTAHETLSNVVDQVNAAARSVADLNDQILQASTAGRPDNELLDQRDTQVRKLGTLVGATQTIDRNGMAHVSVNGINLVSGTFAQTFTLTGGTDIPTSAAGGPPTITWNGNAVRVDSGQAAGLMSVLGTDLPTMSTQLDGVATSIRDAVNSFHSAGFTLSGAAGGNFFSGTGARDLTVVPLSGSQVAVAKTAGTVDGSVAQSIGDLTDDGKAALALGGQPGPLARFRDLSTGLGVQVQSLTQASTVQQSVVQTAQGASDADSGVSLDEEMTSMLLWQRSYQATARVISTVDTMMDTLVNHTGV